MRYLTSLIGMLTLAGLGAQQLPTVVDVRSDFIGEGPVTPSCHASTLEEVRPGRILAAWFGGTHEGAKDVGIYLSASDGSKWSEPRRLVDPLITDGDTLPCWNPVLYRSLSGTLYLFYKVGKNPREWFGAVRTSPDDGDSWTAATYLPEGILGPVRNKPIEVSPGVLLCGSSTESVADNAWRVHIERYYEAEDRWERVPVPNERNLEIIQPTLLRHGADTVQMLCRSKHGRLVSSWSADGGTTWTEADTTGIPNSNSGVDALTLADGNYLLVNNPLAPGRDWWNGRNVLDLEYSTDGLNFRHLEDLERQEEGEYSYPAIIQAADGRIHLTYTYERRRIRHLSLRLE